MKIIDVVPYRVHRHRTTGRQVSTGGAVPWMSQAEAKGWETIEKGWTWLRDDGARGLGRVPAKTREEALAVMAKVNAR